MIETGICEGKEEALKLVESKIKSGEALNKLREMIVYQHGNPDVIEDYSLFPQASKKIPILSLEDGYIKELNALEIGISAMLLGAGRASKTDVIDLSVGIELVKKVGDKVNKGDVLAYLYSNGKNENQAYEKVLNSYKLVEEEVSKNNIILEVIR